jgi:hypothetical protein
VVARKVRPYQASGSFKILSIEVSEKVSVYTIRSSCIFTVLLDKREVGGFILLFVSLGYNTIRIHLTEGYCCERTVAHGGQNYRAVS